MTILSGDIKLIKSQVMLDTDDGGGGVTDQEVIDGQSNNIFPDISELDRTYGRIALRKVFSQIDTNNTDSYFGSHLIVNKAPTDPRVTVALFDTADWFDRRTNARDRLESYLARGPKWSGHLLETQLEGQRAIQQVVRPEDDEPTTGQGLVLVANEGLGNEYEQYVRVTAVSSVLRTFSVSDNRPNVERKVLTIEISDPLRADFIGPSVKEFEQGGIINTANAVLRDTRVADAANYYGIAALTDAVSLGAAQVQVNSIYTNIVPSSQTEVPLIALDTGGQSVALIAGNSAAITVMVDTTVNTTTALFLGSPIMPQSVAFTLFGQSVTDDGGVLKTASQSIGTIDYQNGRINWYEQAGSGVVSLSVTFKPAAAPTRPNNTLSKAVTQDSRSYNYVATLLPIPAPATLAVSYTAQGKVYYLRDAGNGQLKGADAAFGSGSVNYTTGDVLVTCGALPDVDTVIMFNWGTNVATYQRANTAVQPAKFEIDTAQDGLVAGSVDVFWSVEGSAKTAADNGVGGLTGDATGKIDYANGLITVIPNLLPQAGTVFTASYQFGDPQTQDVIGVIPDAGQLTFTIAGSGDLEQGSIELSIPVYSSVTIGNSIGVVGIATLHDVPLSASIGNLVTATGVVQGTVNYQTRECIVTPVVDYTYHQAHYTPLAINTWVSA